MLCRDHRISLTSSIESFAPTCTSRAATTICSVCASASWVCASRFRRAEKTTIAASTAATIANIKKIVGLLIFPSAKPDDACYFQPRPSNRVDSRSPASAVTNQVRASSPCLPSPLCNARSGRAKRGDDFGVNSVDPYFEALVSDVASDRDRRDNQDILSHGLTGPMVPGFAQKHVHFGYKSHPHILPDPRVGVARAERHHPAHRRFGLRPRLSRA